MTIRHSTTVHHDETPRRPRNPIYPGAKPATAVARSAGTRLARAMGSWLKMREAAA